MARDKDSRKLPKRLFKVPDRVTSYEHDRSATWRMKHMSREHEDVLQNIESVLVNVWRNDPKIDDWAATTALRASIKGRAPEEPRAATLFEYLAEIRALREDISDQVWRDGLRTVDDSVHRHSDCRPGETAYLRFVAPHIV